jgi:hypothetical protein
MIEMWTNQRIHTSKNKDVRPLETVTVLYIWVTLRVSYKKQELFTLHEHLSSFPHLVFLVGSMLLIFAFSLIICLYIHSSMLWYPLRCSHKYDVRFVFTSCCLYGGSCLAYVICVCFRIVVSNTYCIVFLFCFLTSCVPYVPSFSAVPIFDFFSVFSNVYLVQMS